MKRIFTLLYFVLYFTSVKATTIFGAEVYYKYLGGLKYEITFKVFRDCRGNPLDTALKAEMLGDNSKTKRLTLKLISITDITAVCNKVKAPCNPSNTAISTTDPAIEEHIYKDTVDFNTKDTAFKKCCSIRFGIGQCCRDSKSTIGAGKKFWVYSELNLCKAAKNNSPIFTVHPNNILCCMQPHYGALGVLDTLDGDSISYSYAEPLEDWKTKISYPSSGDWLTPYYPPGIKTPNPNTDPPIGIYFDPETGEPIFTPMKCGEFPVVCFLVSEWRKDSTGKYQKIGEVRRDIQYIIQTCSGNNSPRITNKVFKYSVCAKSKICFDITTEDKPFIPPPPAKTPAPDTVNLIWNHGINMGSTFTINNPKAREKSAKFCWTPQESAARDLPYSFTVSAQDNYCPQSCLTVKTFYIKVNQIAKTKITTQKIPTNQLVVKSEVIQPFKGTPNYFWELRDSAGGANVQNCYYFKSSKSYASNKQTDTIQFRRGGKYFLHHRINNPPLNCPTDYFPDTLIVPKMMEVAINAKIDTFACWVDTVRFTTGIANGFPPYKYQWGINKKDTFSSYKHSTIKDTLIELWVTDSKGQKSDMSFMITQHIHQNATVDAGKDVSMCEYDSTKLIAKAIFTGDSIYYNWQYFGKRISNKSSLTVKDTGQYLVRVMDDLGCPSNWDTLRVSKIFYKANLKVMNDTFVCLNDSLLIIASGLDNSSGQAGLYQWTDSASKQIVSNTDHYKFIGKQRGKFYIDLTQTNANKCISKVTDSVSVFIRQLPKIELGRGTVCQNETELDLHTIILKPTNSYKGIVNWRLLKTLKNPDGNDNSLTDLVYDKDTSSSDHYYLKVDKQTIDLKTKFIDSVMFGLSYKDEFGCQNFSSNDASIVIRSNVDVAFNANEQKRCFGDSLVYLSNDYGVNYYGGKWFTNNDSSNYLKWPQGNNVQLSEKLGTKTLDPKGGKYLLKYVLENNKCLSSRNAILSIVPYPVIIWAQTDQGDSVVLTDKSTNAERREWYINSKKVSEASSLSVAKTDAKVKAIVLKVFNSNCEADSVIIPKIIGKASNQNLTSFYISPNPVRNEIQIHSAIKQSYKIELINSLGQLVLKKSMNHADEIIDVSHLPDGIYSIIFKTPNAILVQKFIKRSD